MKKRMLCTIVALALLLCSAAPALAASLETKAAYQGGKVVKIEFNQDVEFKDSSVELIDKAMKLYKAKITKKGARSLLVSVPSIKSGAEYKYKVSGVRAKGAAEYGAVGGALTLPDGAQPHILTYQFLGSRKASFQFMRKVEYKAPKVTVVNEKGEKFAAKVVKKSSGELVVSIPEAVKGEKYKLTLSGVRVKGQKDYGTVSKEFRVPPNSRPTVKSVQYKEGYVIVEFNEKIDVKGAKASVKGSNGKRFSAKITKSDDTRVRFDVKNPVAGKSYAFSLSGIRVHGGLSYTSVTGKFTAPAAA